MMKQAFLVDDSKSARIVLSRLLKKNGFDQVEMAESGEDALEQLKNITPDAIFVDFLMDGMDGLETINEIKKDPRFQHTPVVMCTANEGDEYVRAAVDHGALGILAKPPTDQSLGEIIAQIENHQRETVRSSAAAAQPAAAAAPAAATMPGVDENEIGRIVTQIANDKVAEIAARQAEEVATRLVVEKGGAAVHAYLDKHLEGLVTRVVDQRLAAMKPKEIDVDDLRSQVVQQVNGDMEEFLRQLSQRTLEGLVEASMHEQITELATDFSQRLGEVERRILAQVPEKNEMIDHIRVVTEGSLEAQVRETATQVAQEVSNSVATETVETLLDQHLAHQSRAKESSKGAFGWLLVLLLLLAAGAGAYFYLLI